MHENYTFTSFPSCYASVIKQNVNSIILISKKDIARIVKTSMVKTVMLQASLPKRNFRVKVFLGIFRETVFFRNVSRKALPYDFIKQDSTTVVSEKT